VSNVTPFARPRLRTEELKTPEAAAKRLNDILLEVFRKLDAAGVDLADTITTFNTTINNLNPTVLALTAAGASPNANAASVTFVDPTYTLQLQPADGTYPGIISGANQTLNTGAVVLTLGLTTITGTMSFSGSTAIQFNGSSTNFIRVAGGGGFGTGTNLELGSATGIVLNQQTWVDNQLGADRYSVNNVDDQSASPGNFTTTRSAGRAAIAAGAAAVVITNNTAGKAFAATDDVFWSWIDDDATATGMKVVSAANTVTFTVLGGVNATANTRFAWWVRKST
jgi:hypothetical protein